jgi:hypothetical protein
MSLIPKKIVILRHGEKPGAPDSDDAAGGNPNLSVRGYCRAGALAPSLPSIFGKPDFIFASAPSHSSNRPVETVTPLSQATGVSINDKHADDDYAKVANDVQNAAYSGKTVVICWHHGKIPELATALGVTPPITPWPGDVFDRYWVITADGSGEPQVVNLSQRLLYGDDAD